MKDFSTVMMDGSTWKVRFVTRRQMPKSTLGICNRHKKELLVRKDLCDLSVLDTLIHEVLHANNEILFEAEEFVTALATSIAKTLVASGMIEIKR